MIDEDTDAVNGILLGQLIGGGYSWPAPAVDAWGTEPDLGYPKYQTPPTGEPSPRPLGTRS